jgi:hypothetical protein
MDKMANKSNSEMGKARKPLKATTKKTAVAGKREPVRRDHARAGLIKKTMEITGYSKDTVKRVLNGTRTNHEVMACYLELKEGDNKLLKAVKEAVPFDLDKELVVSYQ